ncbi:MAG TPA: hypothetical protein VFP68_02445, partial [Burkholderiaceae bacterium]|nr:hypothetical protein [Burkholderiaceae bacterium]
ATHPIGPPSGALAALLLLAGIEPASSSRLASTPDAGPLGRVQLPFLGSIHESAPATAGGDRCCR